MPRSRPYRWSPHLRNRRRETPRRFKCGAAPLLAVGVPHSESRLSRCAFGLHRQHVAERFSTPTIYGPTTPPHKRAQTAATSFHSTKAKNGEIDGAQCTQSAQGNYAARQTAHVRTARSDAGAEHAGKSSFSVGPTVSAPAICAMLGIAELELRVERAVLVTRMPNMIAGKIMSARELKRMRTVDC